MVKENKNKSGKEILLRYVVGAIVAIFVSFVPIFYIIFRPLTIFPVFWILNNFYNVKLNGLANMVVNGVEISFIDACIAGSAFMLLFLLNVFTRDISFKKRVLLFLFDCGLLLLLNIFRIVILVVLLLTNYNTFDFAHKAFWYVLSTVFVVVIWLISVLLFKIKAVPFYSDVKFLFSQRKLKNLKN